MKNFNIKNDAHVKNLNEQVAESCGFDITPSDMPRHLLRKMGVMTTMTFGPVDHDSDAAKVMISKKISLIHPDYSGESTYKAIGLTGAYISEGHHENWRVAVCMCIVKMNESEQAQAEFEKAYKDEDENPCIDSVGSS